MIRVSKLVRKYRDTIAVDEVSFEITRGEVVGLLGHNGAGKTTIMKMLTGYLEPDSGEIEIGGKALRENEIELKNTIGYLPEQSPLYPDMTVIEYLEYVADLRGISRNSRKDRLTDVINKTSLNEKVMGKISTLSRGYKQRLGVAQAILHRPQILILDEPTNGLDPAQIQQMRSLINELSASTTVLLSTHILQEVQAVCDRVIIINRGRLAVDSGLQELQTADRLSVSLDVEPEEAMPFLGSLEGVGEVIHRNGQKGKRMFSLSLTSPSDLVAPDIARAAIEKGWRLFELAPEHRTLETVFSEVNAGGDDNE